MHNFTSIASLLGVILIGLSASGLRTADRPHRRHQQDWAAGRPAEQPFPADGYFWGLWGPQEATLRPFSLPSAALHHGKFRANYR